MKEALGYKVLMVGTAQVALFDNGEWVRMISGGEEAPALDPSADPPATPTALDPSAAAPPTALDPPDPNALLEVPDKFKGEDGKLNEQGILKSYGDLEKQFRALGKPPETAEGYELKMELPEGAELNEEAHKEFLGRCFEKGMTNDMVQFIMDEYTGMAANAVAEQANTKEDTVATLKELYGNDYPEKMASALNAFNAAGVKDIAIADVGNNSAMIQILAVLGENLTEDQIPNNAQSLAGGLSDEELSSLMKSDAYLDGKHADHKAVLAKVTAHFKAEAARKGKK